MLVCDECELAWRDLDDVARFGEEGRHQAAYPECPVCRDDLARGRRASSEAIAGAGLADWIAGFAE